MSQSEGPFSGASAVPQPESGLTSSALFVSVMPPLFVFLWATGFVSPDSFPLFLSISLVVGLVIGGAHSVWAVAFGAAFIHLVPQWTSAWSSDIPWVLYGVLMIASVWLMPKGLAGVVENWRARRPDPHAKIASSQKGNSP